MSQRHDLNVAVRDYLQTQTGKTGFILVIPSGTTPEKPYFILYPLAAGMGEGSFDSPEEDRWFPFQIASVGQDERAASWMSDAIRVALLGRAAGGGYAHAIGQNVNERQSLQLGAILPGGEEIFQIQDVYQLKVGV